MIVHSLFSYCTVFTAPQLLQRCAISHSANYHHFKKYYTKSLKPDCITWLTISYPDPRHDYFLLSVFRDIPP